MGNTSTESNCRTSCLSTGTVDSAIQPLHFWKPNGNVKHFAVTGVDEFDLRDTRNGERIGRSFV